MAFHDAPGPDRVMFCSVGYARGPETRVYMDGSDAGLSRGEVVAALNGWVVDKDTIAELRARIAALESQLADRDAEIERLRADLVWAIEQRITSNVGWDGRAFIYHPAVGMKVGEHDGTPDSICRAVREARDGVS